MELPPFSIDQLAKLTESNVPPSQLFEILSQYETDASLMSAGSGSQETGGGDSELLSLFYSCFFFAHLLTNQLPEARALTQRMPENLRHQDPSLQNCLTLLRALWQTQHAQVYRILRGLPWPDTLQPLVRRYESFFQDQTLISVSTSYEAIRPATAANYLGLDPQAAERGDQDIIEKFTRCGWTWDPKTKLLYPFPIAIPSTDKQSSNSIRETMAMLGTRGS
ncbi:COP9 signalosome subunit CSN8 [Penicillium macrosclerotiorum]|uniref:COP9 signalosome subunit CSN8 n=1 Tax=Penicillium macrosclerotiorum TaxID=303699 RepID=UPI002549590B|nr:COP9 signalosome subunit CSN8 [Penicillium macrosclerotiorum]KAJ5675809.1 COP9 signalosome subunit CSN8 [Penicillium macrosclerotiorum]